MRMSFRNLNAEDLRTDRWAEVLVHVEAEFHVVDAGCVVYSEPYFPVVDLAHALALWSRSGADDRENFEFESMSFDERGAVRIEQLDDRWRVGSAFEPDKWSGLHTLREVDDCVSLFIEELHSAALRQLNMRLEHYI